MKKTRLMLLSLCTLVFLVTVGCAGNPAAEQAEYQRGYQEGKSAAASSYQGQSYMTDSQIEEVVQGTFNNTEARQKVASEGKSGTGLKFRDGFFDGLRAGYREERKKRTGRD